MAMRGFLHQLATRSLGLAPDIRPRAALPYAAPPEEPSAGDDNPVAMPASAAASPNSIHDASANIVRPSAQPLPGEVAAPPGTRSPATPASDPLAAKPLVPPAPADRQPPPHLATPPAPDHTRVAMPAPIVHTPARQETTPTPVAPAINPPSSPRSASPTPDLASLDLESLIARLVRPEPATAAPESPASAPTRTVSLTQSAKAALPQAPSVVAKASPADTEPAPEVHITIGRLEVNPPARPTPPPAPRPRGPAPLSLADYLARRNGGRP
ncbi:MAG: hypothetical protein JNN31_01285 [Dechloromonas sp.]|nr:hypothetical protein [Dechloromonas sp.]